MGSPKVAHADCVLSSTEFVIAHGSSKFLKSEKFAALKRQEKDSSPASFKILTVYCFVRLSIYVFS